MAFPVAIVAPIISAILGQVIPKRPPTPAPSSGVTLTPDQLQLILTAIAGKQQPPPPPPPPPPPVLSPIDQVLGGQTLVGMKTPLAILAYAGMSLLQAGGGMDVGSTTSSILTTLIAAFGGLGLTAKVDRAVRSLGTIAEHQVAPPPPPQAEPNLFDILGGLFSGIGQQDDEEPSDVTVGPTQKLVGKMSHFGGPEDMGVKADEGLAFITNADLDEFSDYFLPQQPPGTTGLARRLNPNSFYIACRWDYSKTPKDYLKTIKVRVTNPRTGQSEMAQPMDWGPHIRTGRIADLSPGLEQRLGLVTDNVCEVDIPLPNQGAVAGGGPAVAMPTTVPLRVLSESQIRASFGDFRHEEAGGGRIRILGDWAQDNIVTVEIEELRRFVSTGKVECHRAIAPSLKAAFAEISRRGLLDRIVTYDGLWVPRHKTWDVNRGLSSHSWGIAFDINASWNGYGVAPPAVGRRGSVIELVPIFETFGFAWGGNFRPASSRDGMHFEYCRTQA